MNDLEVAKIITGLPEAANAGNVGGYVLDLQDLQEALRPGSTKLDPLVHSAEGPALSTTGEVSE